MPDRQIISALSERWFNRLVIGGVALGFLALVVAGISAAWSIAQTEDHTRWVRHTYQVEGAVAQFNVLNERSETARRGIMLRHDPAMSRVFAQTVAGTGGVMDMIQRLTSDNPRQQRAIVDLRALKLRHMAALERSVRLAEGGERPRAIAEFATDGSLAMLFRLREIAQGMMDEEARLLVVRDNAERDSVRLFYIIVGLSGLLLLLVGAASIWVILRYTRDLSTSRNALRALNADLEGAVRERTIDLQRANDEIQRFAYIVSHDLRSPLVNVMGFTAELETSTKVLAKLVDRVEEVVPDKLDPAARDAARIDLPEAIGFIRSSTQKMDRLINAILRLAREGRRPITPERLDIGVIARGIADSLKHRSDELGAEILIEPDLPSIQSDRLAVEQILSNIVENALKYLKRGVPGRIAISGRREGPRAVFEVTDNGRGIDPRDHDRVFDLFRRSGVQDQPGEGIGLAHTRALAYRLGGTIGVDSRLGEGATFRVMLPLVFAGEQGILA